MTLSKTQETLQQAHQLANTVDDVMVYASQISQSILHGPYGRKKAGIGEKFWSFKNFQDGDNPRSIDWRQSAKSDDLYIREKEWDVIQKIRFDYYPHDRLSFKDKKQNITKHECSLILMAALSLLLTNQGCLVSTNDPAISFGRSPHHIAQIVDHYMSNQTDNNSTILQKNIIPVLIDDFMMPIEQIAERYQSYRFSGTGVMVQILYSEDNSFDFEGRIVFEDFNGHNDQEISKAETIKSAYKKRFDAHQRSLTAFAKQNGLSFVTCVMSKNDMKATLNALHQCATTLNNHLGGR